MYTLKCIYSNEFCKVSRLFSYKESESAVNLYAVYPIDHLVSMHEVLFFDTARDAVKAAQTGQFFHHILKNKGVIK